MLFISLFRYSYQKRTKQDIDNHFRIMDSKKIDNRLVFTSVILLDIRVAEVLEKELLKHYQNHTKTQVINAFPSHTPINHSHNRTAINLLLNKVGQNRIDHARNMSKSLGFPVSEWFTTYGTSCPYNKRDSHMRGILFSHYQIWRDFYLQEKKFDHVKDRDVLLVFEDTADIAITNIKETLESEILNMNSDLKYFGWCHQSNSNNNHNSHHGVSSSSSCLYAYALQRSGVRKLISSIDFCGDSLESQILKYQNTHSDFNVSFPDPSYEQKLLSLENYQTSSSKGIFLEKFNFFDNLSN